MNWSLILLNRQHSPIDGCIYAQIMQLIFIEVNAAVTFSYTLILDLLLDMKHSLWWKNSPGLNGATMRRIITLQD